MKLILKIARNELRNLFYTPVAWFLLILFWVLCAIFYEGRVYRVGIRMYYQMMETPYAAKMSESSFTAGFITDPSSGLFADVLRYLYLFVPLLTMGVISREFNSGTFRLLYSSPTRLRQLILGKYLGLSIFNLLFLLILGAYMVTAAFDIKSVEANVLISASLGVYLLLSAYAAIGFFASSLTRYPVVAALISFVILMILSNIHQVWQEYNFVRDLTYFLGIHTRTSRMLKGLMTTKDVIYFLVIIVMFFSFSLLVLKNKMQSLPWYIKTARYLAVIIPALALGYISSRQHLTGYLDTTSRNTNTLHTNTQRNLEKLQGAPLEVTLYTNLFGDPANRDMEYVALPGNINAYLDMWEPYRRFKKDIEFKYVYYYAHYPGDSALYHTFPGKSLKQIAGIYARLMQIDSTLFIGPEEIKKIIDLDQIQYGARAKLNWKGRSVIVDFLPSETGSSIFQSNRGTSEIPFNAAFRRLAGVKMPRLGFTTGELERSIIKSGEREYSWLNSLYALGFDMDTINLIAQNVPADITTLILSDPKQELNPIVTSKLKNYIRSGGNMFILGEPGKQYVLNPFLKDLGVQLEEGMLVQPTYHETPDNVWAYTTPQSFSLSDEHDNIAARSFQKYTQHLDPGGNMMRSVTSLAYTRDSGFNVTPLLMTQPRKSWRKIGKLVEDSTAPVFRPQDGDVQDTSFPVGLQLIRRLNGKEQRIVVAGDADFASVLKIHELGQPFLRSIFSWLNDNRFPIYTPFPTPKDNWLTMTPGWAKLEKLLYIWVVPALLLILGTVLLTRRKRK